MAGFDDGTDYISAAFRTVIGIDQKGALGEAIQ